MEYQRDIYRLAVDAKAQGIKLMGDTTALQAAVAANTAETQAVVAAVATLTATDASLLAQLQAAQANGDQAAIDSVTQQLVANNAAITAALPTASPAPSPAPAAPAA